MKQSKSAALKIRIQEVVALMTYPSLNNNYYYYYCVVLSWLLI